MWHNFSKVEKAVAGAAAAITLGGVAWVGTQTVRAKSSPAYTLSEEDAKAGRFPVHVAGAVENPTVITADDRMIVADAIELAGGATREADLSQLNLAAKLEPNTQVYVPIQGETAPPSPYLAGGSPSPSASGGGSSVPAGLRINLNTATQAELERLPGVGPVTAQRIIEYRSQVGAFQSVEELENVKGIGPKKLEQISPYVTVR